MRFSFRLGRIFGIPIHINYTWFLIFVLVTVSLALGEFPRRFPGASGWAYWLAGVLGSLLFFGSVLAHELAHSVVARSRGVRVRDITLFLFGGVSSIEAEMDRPEGELFMAGVGPATSLVLALFFAIGSVVARAFWGPLPAGLLSYLATINGGLAAFNLLPGLPLDGGRILRAILWQITGNYRRSTGIAVTAGRAIAFLFIGGGILWAFLGGGLSGLWLAFIGWFMENAATQTYRSMLLQEALRGVTVEDLMTPECTRIPGGLSVSQLVDDYIFPQGRRCFMVVDGDTLEGMVTVHNVRDLPRERWPVTPVAAIMTPLARLIVARPQEDAFEVLRRMDEWNVNQMPVIEEGRFLGMVARDSLIRYLRTWADLGL